MWGAAGRLGVKKKQKNRKNARQTSPKAVNAKARSNAAHTRLGVGRRTWPRAHTHPTGVNARAKTKRGCAGERRLAGARRVSGPLGWRRIACSKRPAHLLGREGVCALRRDGAGFSGELWLASRCMRQPRLQRVGQAPGAGGVCFFAMVVAGCGVVCQRIHIACGCRGCGAAHHLLNVPRLMQGRTRQGVEQRHQQKHDVGRQGGGVAAQHEGMRIILKCGVLCADTRASNDMA